jgi:hypothetical protein
METPAENEQGVSRELWFVLGYMAAYAVMYLSAYIAERLTDLLSTDVVITSPNGTAETPADKQREAETIEQGERET